MGNTKDDFIRCVHPQKGAQMFRRSTAMKPSWQKSTGWMPQPLIESEVLIDEKEPVEPTENGEVVAPEKEKPAGKKKTTKS